MISLKPQYSFSVLEVRGKVVVHAISVKFKFSQFMIPIHAACSGRMFKWSSSALLFIHSIDLLASLLVSSLRIHCEYNHSENSHRLLL